MVVPTVLVKALRCPNLLFSRKISQFTILMMEGTRIQGQTQKWKIF